MKPVAEATTFRRAVASHALSAGAQSLPVVALAVYVHGRTGSAAWAAAATAVRLVAPVVFAPLAGVLGDCCDRRRVLVAGNAAAAIAMAGLCLLMATGAPVLAVLAVAALASAGAALEYPAVVASTPDVAPGRDPVEANAVISTVESAAFMIGPGLGGLLLAGFSPPLVVAAAALALAAACCGFARTPPWDTDRSRPAPTSDAVAGGVRACAAPDIRPLVLVLLATEFLYGCTIVLIVLLAATPRDAGLLNASFSAGVLAAVLLAGPVARAARPGVVLSGSTLASGVPLAALAVVSGAPPACVLLAVCGAASALVEVELKTMLQRDVRADVLARCLGLLDGAACGAIVAGTAVTPALVEAAGAPFALVALGAVLPACAVVPLVTKELRP